MFHASSSFLGSDLAGEAAAALAASSIVFRNVDSEYSVKCLQHAKDLYRFADTYRGFYHKAIPGGQEYYESADYGDELAWAAAWLYNATAESKYLHDAVQHYQHFHLDERPNRFFYNKKTAGVQVREFTPCVQDPNMDPMEIMMEMTGSRRVGLKIKQARTL